MRKPILFLLLAVISAVQAKHDIPQPVSSPGVTILTGITAQGQKATGLALEYESNVLSGSDLRKTYRIYTALDGGEKRPRTVVRAYVNDEAAATFRPKAGRYVIIELDDRDENADLYFLQTENAQPMKFRAKDKDGRIIETEKVQSNKVPHYYGERLVYHIEQTGYLKLTDGKTVDRRQISQSAVGNRVKTEFIDDFTPHRISLKTPANSLAYRLYKPQPEKHRRYPLTVFLHGSGQVGNDNLAHLLSSKGAIAALQYEPGFVLAPQYGSVFDPFDDANKGQRGGIHWQTENRQALVLKMIDETLAANPSIDKNRIYLIGLSRGAEGALNLLLKRPHFFAAALLLSGREAGTLEWMDGNAGKAGLAAIKHMPIWLFHSKEDKVSPVQGSRINYQILSGLRAPKVKYTEFSFSQAGDNGIINNNPHNTWDAVFNSPEVMEWLLRQRAEHEKQEKP